MNNRSGIENLIINLINKYYPEIVYNEDVVSVLTDYIINLMLDIIKESDKIAEFFDNEIITGEFILEAIEKLKIENNLANNHEIREISEINFMKNKNEINVDQSIININNQENIFTDKIKHIVHSKKENNIL